MAIEPDMTDPDWDRYLVKPGAAAPVGNPIRWGGTVTTQIIADGITRVTQPIVFAASADDYARGWSILGVLTMPGQFFYDPFPTVAYPSTPASGAYPAPADPSVNVSLELSIGLGQITFKQRILLMAGGEPTLGLCNTQAATNGGPYAETYVAGVARPFAAVGAIVANSLSITAIYEQGISMFPDIYNAIITVGVAPIAAGTKL